MSSEKSRTALQSSGWHERPMIPAALQKSRRRAGIYLGVFSTTLLLDKLNPWVR